MTQLKWLVTSGANGPRLRDITAKNAALICRLALLGSATPTLLQESDLNRQKDIAAGVQISTSEEKIHDTAKSKLALLAIRELGNEEYFQERGFSSARSRTVPVGI